MFFDVRAAKLLKPGEHLAVEGCLGLRLVASTTKRTWTYRYKSPMDGRMEQVALGQSPAMSIQAAASAWQALRDQRGTGADPGQQVRDQRNAVRRPPVDPSTTTVRRVVEDLCTRRRDPGHATRACQRGGDRVVVDGAEGAHEECALPPGG